MGVMLVYCADWLTWEVPYEGDSNASRVARRGMRTHTIPAMSRVYAAVFTNGKVVANVGPSIDVHVVVLYRTHSGTAVCLGSAGCGAGVVNYDIERRPRIWTAAPRGS